MSKDIRPQGVWTAVGSFFLIFIIAFYNSSFGIIFSDLFHFFGGNIKDITRNNTPFLEMICVIFGVVCIALPISIFFTLLSEKHYGKLKGQHALDKYFIYLNKEDNLFYKFFIFVFIEELFARYLFLRFLYEHPLLDGTIWFYVLLLIGNSLWAFVHIYNFKDKKDRKILRVAPQFVSGIFYSYVFYKYGLLAVIITHYSSNIILLSTIKFQKTNLIDFYILIYEFFVFGIAYYLFDKPLSDVLVWFSDNPTFEIASWGFWDYLLFNFFISGILSICLELLMFDRSIPNCEKNKETTFWDIIFGMFLIYVSSYILFLFFGLFVDSVQIRILIISIAFCMLSTQQSGSALARTFWSGIFGFYLLVCTICAIGFLKGILFLIICTAINYPLTLIKTQDD